MGEPGIEPDEGLDSGEEIGESAYMIYRIKARIREVFSLLSFIPSRI